MRRFTISPLRQSVVRYNTLLLDFAELELKLKWRESRGVVRYNTLPG